MITLDPGAFAYFRPFVRRLTGTYLVLQLDGSRHDAFTDGVWLSVLLRPIAPRLAAALAPGSVNASAAVGAESAYLDAFFDARFLGACILRPFGLPRTLRDWPGDLSSSAHDHP
jgi:hypothetical protein